jgi:hypothetical protein
MTPIWKIKSGQFAGWYSNDALYDALGHYVGFLAGTVAYGPDGRYLGEIHQAEWLGRSPLGHATHPSRHAVGENVAHARLEDRPGLGLTGWEDPDI